MTEIYVSTDVEVDGPIPGPYSMLSIGSAAFASDKTLVATFNANLHVLPGATSHPDTMAWWDQQPEAWAACRRDLQLPEDVMQNYASWVKKLPNKPIFVGYPVVFDFMFVQWYLMKFVGESHFQHSAIDIRSYAMAVLRKPYSQSSRKSMPKRWMSDTPHTHVALDDAINQGELFCAMLQDNTGLNN